MTVSALSWAGCGDKHSETTPRQVLETASTPSSPFEDDPISGDDRNTEIAGEGSSEEQTPSGEQPAEAPTEEPAVQGTAARRATPYSFEYFRDKKAFVYAGKRFIATAWGEKCQVLHIADTEKFEAYSILFYRGQRLSVDHSVRERCGDDARLMATSYPAAEARFKRIFRELYDREIRIVTVRAEVRLFRPADLLAFGRELAPVESALSSRAARWAERTARARSESRQRRLFRKADALSRVQSAVYGLSRYHQLVGLTGEGVTTFEGNSHESDAEFIREMDFGFSLYRFFIRE